MASPSLAAPPEPPEASPIASACGLSRSKPWFGPIVTLRPGTNSATSAASSLMSAYFTSYSSTSVDEALAASDCSICATRAFAVWTPARSPLNTRTFVPFGVELFESPPGAEDTCTPSNCVSSIFEMSPASAYLIVATSATLFPPTAAPPDPSDFKLSDVPTTYVPLTLANL